MSTVSPHKKCLALGFCNQSSGPHHMQLPKQSCSTNKAVSAFWLCKRKSTRSLSLPQEFSYKEKKNQENEKTSLPRWCEYPWLQLELLVRIAHSFLDNQHSWRFQLFDSNQRWFLDKRFLHVGHIPFSGISPKGSRVLLYCHLLSHCGFMLVSTSTSGAGSSDHQLNAIQSTCAFTASLFSDFLFLFAATKGQMGNLHDSLFTESKHGA